MAYTQAAPPSLRSPQEQRYQIYILHKAGHQQSTIATMIGVHKSTLSRELCRNRGQRGYRAQQAQQQATERRHRASAGRALPRTLGR